MDKFLEVMEFEEGMRSASDLRNSTKAKFEERLAGFVKGYMNWTPAKREAFLQEAGAETTTDFSILFANVLDRMILPKYKSQAPDYREYIKIGSSRDFRPQQAIGLWGLRGALDQKPLRGEYKSRALSDGYVQISLKSFGNQFPIGWETFINDDLNALGDIANDFVTAALRTEWKEATKLIAAASGPHTALFGATVSHPVDGTAITNKDTKSFSATNLGLAIAALRKQVDKDGEPIIVTRFHLVVPPALEMAALQALNSAALIAVGLSSTSTKETQTSWNVLSNYQIKLHVNPYLPIITTASNVGDHSWYVLADPTADGPSAQLNFLRGRETPEVLMKAPNKLSLGGATMGAMEGDYETDKVGFRVRHIMGGVALDPRYCYANEASS